jgi:hypothetical protein
MDCIATAEEMLLKIQSRQIDSQESIDDWNGFIEELKRKEALEKARIEARDRARTQANDE